MGLKETVDKEIGNDTELFRTGCLKYINYGRQLLSEEMASGGQFTKAQVDEVVSTQVKSTAKVILDEVDKIEQEVTSRAAKVEEFTEKQAFFKLKMKYAGNESVSAVLAEVEALMQSVDVAHTKVLTEYKAPALQQLRERYA